ncbi:hypothetical protein LQ953_08265 [Sphingomonas sp. IC-56]|uniref:hypothetical protein n=1 Tax=Sphingomonas sp. IC-56 TaxID=2898529 RepID=UPI001E2AD1FA|nr:hypothetical protein [Sphingomonas sp. IC-56]MCD2324002.1 hypothetical protein [Sphingomonas sp. IC-56]
MKAPIALLGAGIVGALAALSALVLPTATLESLVMGSGLPAIIAAAEPPLGFTARFCLALGAGGFFGIMAGLTLFVLVGTKTVDLQTAKPRPQPDAGRAPVLRRADAHPDAPPRPPLMAARDLGTPFLEVGAPPAAKPLPLTPLRPVEAAVERPLKAEAPIEAAPLPLKPVVVETKPEPIEQPLPADLDQPLAAFDPQAVPDVPLPPPILPPLKPKAEAAPAPAEPKPAPVERFETFALPPRASAPAYPFATRPRSDEALARPETEASVHALLERLERGVIRRGAPAAIPKPEPRLSRGEDRGLEDTLASLRSMARRA